MVAQPRGAGEVGGAERILQSAIELFGRQGVRATSLKSIAERAEVSAALILHHYGSKEGLRIACDERVAEVMRTTKTETVAQGAHLDPLAILAAYDESRPVVRYLARTLTDGSPHVNDLVDEMVADAVGYTVDAERLGLVKPSADNHARVVVLMLWSLGTLVLHEHLRRLLDVDLLDGSTPLPYMKAVLEVYTEGVLVEGTYQELREMTDHPADVAGEEREER